MEAINNVINTTWKDLLLSASDEVPERGLAIRAVCLVACIAMYTISTNSPIVYSKNDDEGNESVLGMQRKLLRRAVKDWTFKSKQRLADSITGCMIWVLLINVCTVALACLYKDQSKAIMSTQFNRYSFGIPVAAATVKVLSYAVTNQSGDKR